MKDDLIHVGGLLSWSAIRNFGRGRTRPNDES